MLSRAALLYDQGQDWVIEQIEVDPPKVNEVVVQWKAAGLCHSDEHIVTGDMVPPREAWEAMGITDLFPMIGGHEGSGIVVQIGVIAQLVGIAKFGNDLTGEFRKAALIAQGFLQGFQRAAGLILDKAAPEVHNIVGPRRQRAARGEMTDQIACSNR